MVISNRVHNNNMDNTSGTTTKPSMGEITECDLKSPVFTQATGLTHTTGLQVLKKQPFRGNKTLNKMKLTNEQLEQEAKRMQAEQKATEQMNEKNKINDEAAKARQLVGCIVSKTALIAALNNLQGDEVLINTQQDEVENVGMCGMIEITDGKSAIHFFNKEFIDYIDAVTEVPTKVTGEEHYTDKARQVTWDATPKTQGAKRPE